MGAASPDYIKRLNQELEKRVEKNRHYSLRAFARFLEVDPSLLSKIISAKEVPSLKRGDKFAVKLNLSSCERESFLLSIAETQKCASLNKLDSKLTECD